MNKIKTSDAIMYMDCPLKYKLYKEGAYDVPYNASAKTIISCALRDTIMQAYRLAGTRRGYNISNLSKYFSRAWSGYRDTYVEMGGVMEKYSSYLFDSHKRMVDFTLPDKEDVALVGYPVERVIGGNIYTDSLDVVLINKKDTKKVTLLFFDTSLAKKSEIDYGTQLRALMGRSCFLRELKGESDIDISCRVVNLYHKYSRTIDISDADKMNYPRAVRNINKAINDKLFYPRASEESCRDCFFKEQCQWRIS